MQNSAIEWTHHTFNPWLGCTKVSPGCANCYAETLMDTRYGRVKWGKGNPRQRTSESNWKQPLRWNKQANGTRQRVFCASLADVFDQEVSDDWRDDLFNLIYECQNLDWLILTKRPEAARDFLLGWSTFKNVWLGISVEDQERADKRIPLLMQIPAKVRFLSVEPQLEAVDLGFEVEVTNRDKERAQAALAQGKMVPVSALVPGIVYRTPRAAGIHWVICGGESGAGKRPFNPDWGRQLRDQCKAAGIAYFFKQIDKVQPIPSDLMVREFPL